MKNIALPNEAEDAAAELIWQKAGVLSMEQCRELANSVFNAIFEAWPQSVIGHFTPPIIGCGFNIKNSIMLPLAGEEEKP